MFDKRGQAAGAAVLIAIIAGLIVMFIILAPPSEREEILGTSETSDGTDDSGKGVTSRVLLKERPGRIDFIDQEDFEHPLPVINVYTKTESKALAQKNLARAKKRIFSEEQGEFKFFISDLEAVDDLLLSFFTSDSEGNLIVKLNGEEIYNAPAVDGAVQPLKLSKGSLQPDNLVTFVVSSPGLAFWHTNEVIVTNIKVTAAVTSREAEKSSNIFIVSETEKRNLDRVALTFQPSCIVGDVGKLRIEVNEDVIYDAVPDCDVAMVPIEFSPLQVNQGENMVTFFTEKGSYQLSNVVIKSKLKGVDFKTYYFDLSFEQYQSVKSGKMRVRMEMNFVDVTSEKVGKLIFNGNTRNFDTREVSTIMDLSSDIVQGSNAIKIKPDRTLEVRELKVELVK